MQIVLCVFCAAFFWCQHFAAALNFRGNGFVAGQERDGRFKDVCWSRWPQDRAIDGAVKSLSLVDPKRNVFPNVESEIFHSIAPARLVEQHVCYNLQENRY